MPEDPYHDLLEKYPEATKMRYPVGTFLKHNEGDIAKQEVASVLNRLHEYYDGRARAAHAVMGRTDASLRIHELATSYIEWCAKREAIEKVADNLQIMLRVELAKGE